jgi:hypothetical protein
LRPLKRLLRPLKRLLWPLKRGERKLTSLHLRRKEPDGLKTTRSPPPGTLEAVEDVVHSDGGGEAEAGDGDLEEGVVDSGATEEAIEAVSITNLCV